MLADNIWKREFEIKNNMCISSDDKMAIDGIVKTFNKELALMRENTQKLEG